MENELKDLGVVVCQLMSHAVYLSVPIVLRRDISFPVPKFITDESGVTEQLFKVGPARLGFGAGNSDESKKVWIHLAQGINGRPMAVESLKDLDFEFVGDFLADGKFF